MTPIAVKETILENVALKVYSPTILFLPNTLTYDLAVNPLLLSTTLSKYLQYGSTHPVIQNFLSVFSFFSGDWIFSTLLNSSFLFNYFLSNFFSIISSLYPRALISFSILILTSSSFLFILQLSTLIYPISDLLSFSSSNSDNCFWILSYFQFIYSIFL